MTINDFLKQTVQEMCNTETASQIASRIQDADTRLLKMVRDDKRAEVVDLMADYYCHLAGDDTDDDNAEQQWELTEEDKITLIQSLEDAPLIVVNGKIYTPDEALELSAKLVKIRNLAVAGDEVQIPIDDIPKSFAAEQDAPQGEAPSRQKVIGWVNRHPNGCYGCWVYESPEAAKSQALPQSRQDDIALPICLADGK